MVCQECADEVDYRDAQQTDFEEARRLAEPQ